MKPIEFKEQTKVLSKPKSMTDEECSSMAIWNDGEKCISCWKASLKERIRFLFTGKMWLWVLSGVTQPPVLVDVQNPFIKGK